MVCDTGSAGAMGPCRSCGHRAFHTGDSVHCPVCCAVRIVLLSETREAEVEQEEDFDGCRDLDDCREEDP